jgi:rhomboid family GlyGly-CTERM serine protease
MITRPVRLQAYPMLRTIEDKWLLCLAVSCLALVATAWPGGLEHLRYDRFGLTGGEVWRVFSAHLVHLNLYHLFINLFGLVLICELQWGAMPLRHGFGLIGCSGVAIGMALWWLHPELEWYAGLSGALHGLWAGCALYGLTFAPNSRTRSFSSWLEIFRSRSLCLAGLILIAVKLVLEFHYGPSWNTQQHIGGHVVSEAHRYGALAGIIYVLFWRARSLKPGFFLPLG